MIDFRFKNKCFIIAEAGVNHNGQLDMAYKLIDVAIDAGADCVKFQTFITENDTSRNCEKAEYQKNDGDSESQYEMVKKLELSFDSFRKLKEYCDSRKILFLSSPFDLESANFLNQLNPPFWKLASSEVTNFPLLKMLAETHRPIVMSTGMCDVSEIDDALSVLKRFKSGEVTLLHCNTEYPTPFEDVNLRAMEFLRDHYQCNVGYSDHTLGIEVPIAAAILGASIIEKHFTLDNNLEGPDHKASLNPEELKNMIGGIRNVEKSLGDKMKKPSQSELKNKIAARKSIVANCSIKKGCIFNENNLATKRPGGGISPMEWEKVIGSLAVKDFEKDEMIIL